MDPLTAILTSAVIAVLLVALGVFLGRITYSWARTDRGWAHGPALALAVVAGTGNLGTLALFLLLARWTPRRAGYRTPSEKAQTQAELRRWHEQQQANKPGGPR